MDFLFGMVSANMSGDACNYEDISTEFIRECNHPEIQSLKPNLDACDRVWTPENQLTLAAEIDTIASDRRKYIWLPTLCQLLRLLQEKSKNPNEVLLRPVNGEWECVVTIDEWAADYETHIETQRRLTGNDPRLAVLRALKAAIGVGERWMV